MKNVKQSKGLGCVKDIIETILITVGNSAAPKYTQRACFLALINYFKYLKNLDYSAKPFIPQPGIINTEDIEPITILPENYSKCSVKQLICPSYTDKNKTPFLKTQSRKIRFKLNSTVNRKTLNMAKSRKNDSFIKKPKSKSFNIRQSSVTSRFITNLKKKRKITVDKQVKEEERVSVLKKQSTNDLSKFLGTIYANKPVYHKIKENNPNIGVYVVEGQKNFVIDKYKKYLDEMKESFRSKTKVQTIVEFDMPSNKEEIRCSLEDKLPVEADFKFPDEQEEEDKENVEMPIKEPSPKKSIKNELLTVKPIPVKRKSNLLSRRSTAEAKDVKTFFMVKTNFKNGMVQRKRRILHNRITIHDKDNLKELLSHLKN